jgi:hypothetical protein
MKITRVFVTFALLLLGGCASSHLGSYAQFDSVDGDISPLQISARFDGRACSDYFAYIDISIHNPSSQWQKVKDVDFKLPSWGGGNISVMQGDRLAGWAKSERRRRLKNEHNASLANLAVSAIGVGLMVSDNENTRNAGAALAIGSIASAKAKGVSSDLNTVETARSTAQNYFVDNDIEIAPGMTRQFWLVLNANDDAPLMASLRASFHDNSGVQQVFSARLANWQACSWQGERKKYLQKLSSVHPKRRSVMGSPVDSRRSALDQRHLLDVELNLWEEAHEQEYDNF